MYFFFKTTKTIGDCTSVSQRPCFNSSQIKNVFYTDNNFI